MKQKLWLVGLAVAGVLLVVAVCMPTLNQSKTAANEALRAARERQLAAVDSHLIRIVNSPNEQLKSAMTLTESIDANIAQAKAAPSSAPANRQARFALASGVVHAEDQMVVRTAKLDLLTRDLRSSVDQVRSATQRLGGFLEKANLSDTGNGVSSAELIVRVPKARLDEALAAFKGFAVRVENESVQAQDVTRDFVDTEARLRNFKAEEDQYLAILKRAAKVQDTLDVAEKLSGVRGEIERLQADLNYLSHQVEMSAITLNVKQQPPVLVAGWHPGENARASWQSMVSGLTAFVDFVVTVAITLPLILVWIASLALVAWLTWRISVTVRKRMPATSATNM